jgi:predicted DNA-binding WGR domain protein
MAKFWHLNGRFECTINAAERQWSRTGSRQGVILTKIYSVEEYCDSEFLHLTCLRRFKEDGDGFKWEPIVL